MARSGRRLGASRIKAEVATFATDRLKNAANGADVAKTVVDSWALAEQLLLEKPQIPLPVPIACGPGCHHCCLIRIEATPVETIALTWWLEENLSAEELTALRLRVGQTYQLSNGLSELAHAKSKIACSMLVDRKCSVHTMRPLDCRGFESMSVDICSDVLKNVEYNRIPLNQPRYRAFRDARRGLLVASRKCGYEAEDVELSSALHIALTTTDITKRWLAGDSMFTDACFNNW
jgi:hypothetical protein